MANIQAQLSRVELEAKARKGEGSKKMQGVEQAYCDVCIKALLMANRGLMEANLIEATTAVSRYGKGDTLGLDAIPEIEIERILLWFNNRAVLITEELGGQLTSRVNIHTSETPPLFFCDPTDRSKQLRETLLRSQTLDPNRKVGEVIGESGTIEEWESNYSAPASITGATSAITCVRDGLLVFTVILNYITQELILVCNGGIKFLKLPKYESGDYVGIATDFVLRSGTDLEFRPLSAVVRYDDYRNFITFLGKAGYKEHLEECGIFTDSKDRKPVYDEPGGPTRPLYLSNLYQGPPVGFILANGEKIVEWVHWLSFLRFAKFGGERVLELYEITNDRPRTREGISMAPSPAYSIFQNDSSGQQHRVDVRPICAFERPSQFRATLVLVPLDNTWLFNLMRRYRNRRLSFD